MRTIELSNHPKDQLEQLRARREAVYRSRLEQYRATADTAHASYTREVREHAARLEALAGDIKRYRSSGRWVRALRSSRQLRVTRRSPPAEPTLAPPPVGLDQPTSQEMAVAAGIEGEAKTAKELIELFDDDWTLLHGYKNRCGEIDYLLLGPAGLTAIECKHHNGVISCDGEAWRYEKYDRWGNRVEHDWLLDSGGRSPSRQLNEPAALLERFLHRRRQPVHIRRAVLITHPRASRGRCNLPTVDLIATTTAEVRELTHAQPQPISQMQLPRIEALIIRDHKFHAQRVGNRLLANARPAEEP